MSKRAEERALQRYALKEITHESVKLHDEYMCGYEQAEKDLALTWRDIELIVRLNEEVMAEAGGTPKDYSEEVLRRFNEQRNKK